MSLSEQFLMDLLAPPVAACLWWLFSRGWALGIQRGEISERTKTRQKRRFFIFLVLFYAVMFGVTAYENLAK
jgi:hypothetical protein